MNNILTMAFFLILCAEAPAFMRTRSNFGDKLYWNSSSVIMYSDPNYTLSGAGGGTTSGIISTAASQWNGKGNMTIAIGSGSGPVSGRNDLYFSSDTSIFGSIPALSSVLAVTAVSFETATGRVVETDIIINNAKNFSKDAADTSPASTSVFYLGDVLTHEFGHVVGLGHSQVKESTMVYAVYRGQNTLSDDDEAGLKTIYPSTTTGTITGRIIGGSNVGIFAAHVHAISSTTGKVMASIYSDSDGTYSLSGLDLNDLYYIYTSPGNVIFPNSSSASPLPYYYTSGRSDFCTGGANYRGSFYQSCATADAGLPQGVRLTSGSPSQDIGNITIRCSLDNNANYSDAKAAGWNLNNSVGGRSIIQSATQIGEAVVGTFSSAEVTAGTAGTFDDSYTVDLSSLSLTGRYLTIHVFADDLFFLSRSLLNVTGGAAGPYSITGQNVDSSGGNDDGLVLDGDNNIKLSHTLRIPLSATAGQNIFTVNLRPIDLENNLTLGGIEAKEWFAPVSSILADSSTSYFMTLNITQADGTLVYPRSYTISDNSSCTDAPNSVSVTASAISKSTVQSNSTEVQSVKKSPFACGSVALVGNDDNNLPPGPLNLVLGFVLSYLLFFRRRRVVRGVV